MNVQEIADSLPEIGSAGALMSVAVYLGRLWFKSESRHNSELDRINKAHDAELEELNRALSRSRDRERELQDRIDMLQGIIDRERDNRNKSR